MNPTLLAIEVAERLESRIQEWQAAFGIELDVDPDTHPDHLLKMLERLKRKADEDSWPDTKLHRWLGWVMGCMACHGIAGHSSLQQIVGESKKYFSEKPDEELENHHNPDSPFRFDIGGEG
jgi:cytochrome c553